MSRSTKSNIRAVAKTLTSEHVMTPEQQARRLERFEPEIGIPGVVEIGRYRYANAYGRLRLRSHPDGLEICFLARGQQTYRVNNRIYRLRGGDQYLVFPGEPHDSAGMPEEKGVFFTPVFCGRCGRRSRNPAVFKPRSDVQHAGDG